MKRYVNLLAILMLGLGVSACNGDTPTTPSPDSPKFSAVLLPVNEVPAITGAEAAGSGTADITFNLAKDYSGNISAATFDVTVSAAGFPNGTTLTDAHIHSGVAGVSGGVLVSLGLSAGEVTLPNGSASFTKKGITLTVDQANAILSNPASFYLNIHTAANPGGVARGQLTRTQ